MHGGFDTYKAKFEALLSAHYTAAVILHDRTLTLAQFEPGRYDDPKLRAFAAKQVEVRAEPSVGGSQATVDIEMADGATLSARCEHPLGAYENPVSRAQIEHKFRTYAQELAARRPHRGRDRGGRAAGGFRLGAPADGSAARRAAGNGRGGVSDGPCAKLARKVGGTGKRLFTQWQARHRQSGNTALCTALNARA